MFSKEAGSDETKGAAAKEPGTVWIELRVIVGSLLSFVLTSRCPTSLQAPMFS
jgi:hypothetical protein